ncbi:proton-coupled zinc antiporter SLC30A2-like [Ornithodoros turicata]|uniref:proton-coupled zinc antiporter SLC30A2-like n=1 Tax=Ornithodoros turicata TaxID=34597 RepID=UPI003139CF1B
MEVIKSTSSLHCHKSLQSPSADVDVSARRRLICASILCFIFMVLQFVGGILANSLAIATDAAHLLADFASFLISLLSLWWGAKPATKRKSFGWYRAEVLGALTSIVMIWAVTGILVYMAIQKIIKQEYHIQATIMLVSASLGVAVNIVMGLALQVHPGFGFDHHTHGSEDSRRRADLPSHFTEPFIVKEETIESVHGRGSLGVVTGAPAVKEDNAAEPQRADHISLSQTSAPLPVVASHVDTASVAGSADAVPGKNAELQPDKPTSAALDKARVETRTTRLPSAPADTISSFPSRKRSRGIRNFNVRAAFVHVVGDLLQSIGVLIAAIVVYFCPSCGIADPICTLVFSVIVLVTTIAILGEALNALMEGIPHGIDYEQVQSLLLSVPGVARVHDLHIWSLSLDRVALSAHVVLSPTATDSMAVRRDAARTIRRVVDVHKLTLQMEEYEEGIRHDCRHCVEPQD